MALLSISQVHTFYGSIEALRGVDIEVREGEIVTLIGANGAGKSTLLMTVCGNPQAARGTIAFDGADITHLQTYDIIRRGIAHAPEGRRIFPRMTVLENLQMGATSVGNGNLDDDLDMAFDLFPILRERQTQRGGTLSGGQQQMLVISRALMARPRLLLLDEPSMGLAPILVDETFEVIGRLRAAGTTIFLVEQNAYKALTVADRGYVLETGRTILTDSGQALLANETVKAAYLGV